MYLPLPLPPSPPLPPLQLHYMMPWQQTAYRMPSICIAKYILDRYDDCSPTKILFTDRPDTPSSRCRCKVIGIRRRLSIPKIQFLHCIICRSTHMNVASCMDLFFYAVGWQSNQGAVSIRKTVLPGMAIPMLKIRRPNGRLIFNMEIAIRR